MLNTPNRGLRPVGHRSVEWALALVFNKESIGGWVYSGLRPSADALSIGSIWVDWGGIGSKPGGGGTPYQGTDRADT